MKYVLLGTLGTEWAAKHGERVQSATTKLRELGISLEFAYYTQGQYDFVDVVDAPEPEALLTYSLWYVTQGYGHIQSMPAFDIDALAEAAAKV